MNQVYHQRGKTNLTLKQKPVLEHIDTKFILKLLNTIEKIYYTNY